MKSNARSSKKPRISACLVTYHDEHQIERCLESLKGVVDEIIVVHDGKCRDNTLKLARKYTRHVYEAKHSGHPEEHRVTTFNKATEDWILVIDPDEYLSTPLRKNLRRLVSSGKADAYLFLWKVWDGVKYVTKVSPHRIGVVKREKLQFLAILHPDWRVDGTSMNVEYQLEHRPNYNDVTWHAFRTKWTKWMKLHAKQIITPIEKLPKFNYSSKKFVKHIEWIKTYDVLIAPFIFVYFIVGTLISTPAIDRKAVAKFAVLQALYYVLLTIEVRKLKITLSTES